MGTHITTRDRQREESRERLFQAALEIFHRDGFRQARVDDVALVAGLSRTSFYFHFPTKEDVLMELGWRLERPVVARLEGLVDSALPAVVEVASRELAVQWATHRVLALDAVTVRLRAEAERATLRERSLRQLLARCIAQRVERGEVVKTRPAEALADAYLLQCLAAIAAWGSGEDGDLSAALVATGELFLHGALSS